MIYVMDSNSFGVLKNYYPSAFPSFWAELNSLVDERRLVSVSEVRKELARKVDSDHLETWYEERKNLFASPTEDELEKVAKIFEVPHFQQLIGKKQLLKGFPVADPFVIARAWGLEGCAVTEEKFKAHGAQIPNVCLHFGIECLSIREMVENEGWAF